jgi:hypothetical protein
VGENYPCALENKMVTTTFTCSIINFYSEGTRLESQLVYRLFSLRISVICSVLQSECRHTLSKQTSVDSSISLPFTIHGHLFISFDVVSCLHLNCVVK